MTTYRIICWRQQREHDSQSWTISDIIEFDLGFQHHWSKRLQRRKLNYDGNRKVRSFLEKCHQGEGFVYQLEWHPDPESFEAGRWDRVNGKHVLEPPDWVNKFDYQQGWWQADNDLRNG